VIRAFGQRIELYLPNDKVIKYPGLNIEFEINFNAESNGNTGHIRLFNLADKTIQKLKKDTTFLLKAGYKGDVGTLLPGIINNCSTRWNGTEKMTEVVIGDATKEWLNSTINRTWRAGIRASQVAKDLINELPLEIGDLQITKDKTYSKGKTFSTTIQKALNEIKNDLGLKLHVSRGRVYLRPEGKGTRQIVKLNSETGLIAIPQVVDDASAKEEAYKVQSLLNYRIHTDSIVKIESKTIEGLYRVNKGTHRKSGNDFVTEIEVSKYAS